jgi:hypothetical protein
MVRRTLILLAALLTVAALGTTPARAGGPTSVILSAPPYVTAVGYDDQRYADLQSLTQLEGNAAPDAAPDAASHQSGTFVRATWLIHDMSVWRIDIIYPDAPGGPWIATSDALATGKMPAKPTWHQATDKAALLKLLGDLKLLHNSTFYNGPTTLDNEAAPPPDGATPEPEPVQQPAPTAQAQVDESGFFTGWRWILPGLLVGAGIALAAVRFLPARRWELIDAE